MRIDAHHHFWAYDPDAYAWISEQMAVIRRDFLPEHLAEELAGAGLGGAVSVQARQSLEETEWLLALAHANEFIRGVVGWVPLIAEHVAATLERFAGNPKLRSVRHVLQDEEDDAYMLRDDFNRGIRALREFGLVYDILIFERHLPQTIEFVDRHPDQPFVLNHCAKPRIREGILSPWRERIRELAERQNVSCKISGLTTEADWTNWQPADLRPYVETVLDAFGPDRTMLGSDWPVCLVATGYTQWFETVSGFLAGLSQSERTAVRGGTAARVYGLG